MRAALLAQFDLTQLSETFYLGVRFVVAVIAGLLGFLLVAPVVGIAYQVVARRPLPRFGEHLVRLAATIGLGLAAWLLLPIGPGGYGPGPGGGPGKGPGDGGGGKTISKGNGGKETTVKNSTGGKTGDAVLAIEVVTKENYQIGSPKFYLVDKREPPRTLEDVEKLLKDNSQKWKRMDIILYKTSPPAQDPIVTSLMDVARRHGLTPAVPPEFAAKDKPPKSGGG